MDEILRGFIRPFDLSRAPLLRVALAKIDESRHLFMTDTHHIIFDGISNVVFFKDFMDIYSGKRPAPPRLRYIDYSEWRDLPANRDAGKKQEAFWIERFTKEAPVLNIPTDFPRPAAQAFEGKRLDFSLDKEKTDALKGIASQRDGTLYMVLLAIINVLLMKLGGQEDIVVGTPVAGRGHPELEPLIGVFINTLALRNYPEGQKTFDTFLQEVKNSTLKAFENQDCQFEELLDKIEVRRDASRNPLFDVMFRMQNFELPAGGIKEMEVDGLTLREYGHDPGKSMLDLSFTTVELDNGTLVFVVEYCTKLFKTGTVQRFVDYFNTVVTAVIADPGVTLSAVDILTPGEKKRLLVDFNNTALDYPREKTIHRLFEDRVEQWGEKPAVVGRAFPGGRGTFTYAELNEVSNRLARRLIAKGLGPGRIAAILVERTPAMIVGLLGILKTGAAYLPLDPEYPPDRIRYILEKSGARLLLTQGDLTENNRLPRFEGEKIDIFDERIHRDRPGGGENVNPGIDVSAEGPAYIIYTSGSTGNPKGVVIRHRNAVNFIEGMAEKIDFSAGKTILALTTISFDIFFLETLMPLTRGMKVVVADEDRQKDPAMLVSLLVENRVDIVQVTPSRLQLLLDPRVGEHALAGVRELLVGGEAFPPYLLETVQKTFKGRIYNVYGPTETTVWSTFKDLSTTPPGELTIGGPIANTRIYILDRERRLQPVGVAGELFIGGDGVAAGYLNNPELTAEKFCRLPLYHSPPLPLYKTGDLARWLPNGEIEFLGRLDHQVKIRGFRVELEEIEEELLKHEDIKETVVVTRSNPNNDKYLCAYVVLRGGGLNVEELRNRLSARLPSYMLPSYFVPLDAIPLTPNRKVDRNALPEPDVSRSNLGATFVEPGTDNEKIIARLWKEVLQMDEVGIHDNFFDLGGNSMNAIQLNWKLKETFGKEIPVALMFRNLSISFLDSYLSGDPGDREAEKEIERTEALNKAQKTYKNTMAKLIATRRTT